MLGISSSSISYLRLFRSRDFSLLWVGQLVSFFGDRLHQVALGVLVLAQTGSPALLGLVYAATVAPSLLLAPLTGALVDRWSHRRTMMLADSARALMVLAVPFALSVSEVLLLVMVFGVAVASMLFRPAKTGAIPLIVEPEDLMQANSAHSVSETGADLLGYPLAGVLSALLINQLWVLFAIDAGTYLFSALCIMGMAIPAAPRVLEAFSFRGLLAEMREGTAFLWHETALRANTILSLLAQIAVGAELTLSLLYAERVLPGTVVPYPANYAMLMTAIGAGSIVGAPLVGPLAKRIPKGRLAAYGFIAFGVVLAGVGLTDQFWPALLLFAAAGVTNMLFLVPNLTMFQERVPSDLFGRVVSLRMSVVFGVMTLAIALAGVAADSISPATLFVAAGLVCAISAAVGLLFPSVRNTD